jgi:hypothetical protein
MIQDHRTPCFCSKFSQARGRNFPKIVNNLRTRSQKGLPGNISVWT